MNAAAKMPIQASPLLPVWSAPKRVEVIQDACQNPELGDLLMCNSRQGASPRRAMMYTPQLPLPLDETSPRPQIHATVPAAHQKLAPRVSVERRKQRIKPSSIQPTRRKTAPHMSANFRMCDP